MDGNTEIIIRNIKNKIKKCRQSASMIRLDTGDKSCEAN